MVKSFIVLTEILQRPKKKNIIFKEIAAPRFVSIFIFISAVTLVSTFAVTITMKTIKPVR